MIATHLRGLQVSIAIAIAAVEAEGKPPSLDLLRAWLGLATDGADMAAEFERSACPAQPANVVRMQPRLVVHEGGAA